MEYHVLLCNISRIVSVNHIRCVVGFLSVLFLAQKRDRTLHSQSKNACSHHVHSFPFTTPLEIDINGPNINDMCSYAYECGEYD